MQAVSIGGFSVGSGAPGPRQGFSMATVTASRSDNLPRPLACQSARSEVAGPDGQPAPGVDFSAELIRHQRRLYLFIGTMLANPSDIEDV